MLYGTVIHGRGIGSALIGTPTANISLEAGSALPAHGVYAGYVVLSDGGRYGCVINIGINPTVSVSGRISVEAHIMDFSGDIYGERIGIEFLCKIREERKFSSVAELSKQIECDIKAARGAFMHRK